MVSLELACRSNVADACAGSFRRGGRAANSFGMLDCGWVLLVSSAVYLREREADETQTSSSQSTLPSTARTTLTRSRTRSREVELACFKKKS